MLCDLKDKTQGCQHSKLTSCDDDFAHLFAQSRVKEFQFTKCCPSAENINETPVKPVFPLI